MKVVIALAPLLFFELSIPAQPQVSSPAPSWAGPRVVKDAPYFADIISTYDRTLPSGEHLHREIHSKVFRDTQGRTRREVEQTIPATGQKSVTVSITDPVSLTVISLNPQTMTARVRDGSTSAVQKPADHTKPESGLTPPAASPGDAEAAAPTSESAAEDLGTQVMQGLKVKGTKIITRLPPAAQGNTQPRMLVASTWRSEELHIDVLTEIDEVGENHRTIRLVNIVRTEPDAELFKIPSGYAVVDSRPHE